MQLPTQPSSDNDSEVRRSFRAEVSSLLQNAPVVHYKPPNLVFFLHNMRMPDENAASSYILIITTFQSMFIEIY